MDDDDGYSIDYDTEYLQVDKSDGSTTLIPVDTLDILIAFFESKSVMQGNNTKH